MADQLNVTKCKTCGGESPHEEKFSILTLDTEYSQTENESGEMNVRQQERTIEELIKRQSGWQSMTKGNEYECMTCGNRQDAACKTMMVFGPNILVIWLKRFTKEENGVTITKKLNIKVNYQEKLKMP